MKKPLLLLVAVVLAGTALMAQVRIGILGGPNSSSVIESNNLSNWNNIKDNYKSRLGLHAGVVADIPFSPTSKFYFQPGVQFSNKGRKFSQSYDTATHDTSWYSHTQFVNYIEVPLNLLVKFPIGGKAKFIIGGGPYVAFLFNGKENDEVAYKNGDFGTNEVKDIPVGKGPGKYQTLDYGVNALAGFEIGRVFITANYSRGLSDFYQAVSYDGSFKHQVIGGTLGVFLGKQTKAEPKSKDKDKDGIEDKDDACPTEPGTAMTKGCPDKDGDGIADREDKCPQEPGKVKYNGCPVPDTDKDGINDEEDKCPQIAGVAKYGGCAIPDTDKDGINDEEDKCPQVAGVARYNGCPVPDTDGDGISDEEDKCPQTKGTKENGGCPVIKKEILEKVNYAARSIEFEYTKATIRSSSYAVLDEVAKILNQDQSLILAIEGHTSNDGVLDANMKLSQARADNVKAYFVSKGIDASRLHAQGFGTNKPLNSGKTAAEKAKNRRVEMKVSNR
ncbi:MAG: OmpA family protein [Chitinophagaceae bacterium]